MGVVGAAQIERVRQAVQTERCIMINVPKSDLRMRPIIGSADVILSRGVSIVSLIRVLTVRDV